MRWKTLDEVIIINQGSLGTWGVIGWHTTADEDFEAAKKLFLLIIVYKNYVFLKLFIIVLKMTLLGLTRYTPPAFV